MLIVTLDEDIAFLPETRSDYSALESFIPTDQVFVFKAKKAEKPVEVIPRDAVPPRKSPAVAGYPFVFTRVEGKFETVTVKCPEVPPEGVVSLDTRSSIGGESARLTPHLPGDIKHLSNLIPAECYWQGSWEIWGDTNTIGQQTIAKRRVVWMRRLRAGAQATAPEGIKQVLQTDEQLETAGAEAGIMRRDGESRQSFAARIDKAQKAKR